MSLDSAVSAYVAFYETLSIDSLDRLDRLCAPDVHFRDPFNDLRGLEGYRAVLAKMFEDLDEPRFFVTDRAVSGDTCYLRWDFRFRLKNNGAPWLIVGMTELHFDAQARVTAHLDHWDSGQQFYGRLPVLGWFIRQVRKRLAVQSGDAAAADDRA